MSKREAGAVMGGVQKNMLGKSVDETSSKTSSKAEYERDK